MSIHRYSRADEVTVLPVFTDLVWCAPLGLTDNTRPHSKDIIAKPQFVVNFQRDIDLLLYSHVIDKGLQTKAGC